MDSNNHRDVLLADEGNPELLEKIFARRAALLARPIEQVETGEQVELALFRIGKELYGLDVQSILGIHPCLNITRLPRVPEWIKGVTNIGGDILAVLDLQSFLNLSHPQARAGEMPASTYLMRISTAQMELALQVDEVLGIETLLASKIIEISDVTRGLPPEYVRGITLLNKGAGCLVLILNLSNLLADPRLIIQEEIL